MKPYRNKHIIVSTPDNQAHDIFRRDNRGGLTFHSRYDNYDDALEERDNLDRALSQSEVINMMKDLFTKVKS